MCASHFSTAAATTNELTGVCGGEDRTKEQSNGVPENLSRQMVSSNRAIYQDRHARIIIMARRTISN